MMRRILVTIAILGTAFGVYAQGTSAANATDISTLPPSSIDLLKRSLGASNAAGSSSLAVETSSQTVVKSQAAAAEKPTARAKDVLEMPLASGEVVTTKVTPNSKPAVPARKPVKKAAKSKVPANVSNAVAAPTVTEQEIENHNALAPQSQEKASPSQEKKAPTPQTETAQTEQQQDAAAQAELDYASRLLQQSREENVSGRFIPQPVSRTVYETAAPAVSTKKPYNPNDYRPGVEWQRTDSTHFIIYTQKRNNGIGTSNMPMIFESAYATLRRNIPWMMSDKVRVFVYQDHTNYLTHEPNAKAWTRALAYPTRGEVVVYDEVGKQQELKEVFTHELVHIFTQKFFDKHNSGRLVTPVWLDEGLAVYMEDQAYNGAKGGPWTNDLKTLNFKRSPESQTANFSSSAMFGSSKGANFSTRKKGKPLYFMPFDQFMHKDSLAVMEGRGKTQDWYFQAYAMVRFLLNPSGGNSPSNRMQFEQFTRLIAQGEQVRNPNTGLPVQNAKGQPIYRPYSAQKALERAYRYNTATFEDAFWRWADK